MRPEILTPCVQGGSNREKGAQKTPIPGIAITPKLKQGCMTPVEIGPNPQVMIANTVQISMIRGIPIFALGVLNFIFAKFLRQHAKLGENDYFVRCFWLKESKISYLFFAALGLLYFGLCFIHFGAIEKHVGYLGLWDCSPFLHRHTNADQLDSGIVVHSTDMQSKKQECQMIFVNQFSTDHFANWSIIVHMAQQRVKQLHRKPCEST